MVSSTLKITEKPQNAVQYPKAVAFIIGNEFCERFNYYGMRTILVLYLTDKLKYGEDQATVLFHIFTSLVYVFPLIGAVLADSWLGRFKTIWYLSIVYTIGAVVIALGAVPVLHLPVAIITVIGLLLIAIGTGGIKPCVSAFGGDQFKLPEQAKQLATFFSLFYFAINAGSLISTTITPILRADVYCFGDKDCFSLAFSVPAVLMVLSLIIFIIGKPLYDIKPPSGNMIYGVFKCICQAIRLRCKEGAKTVKTHWLDHAEEKCGMQMVQDTKALLKILVLYLPLPVFWALFDQQGSRWTFQATRMVGDVGFFTIKPDQMQVINPLLILGFIPLFNYLVYPLLAKVGIKRPLQKLTFGGLLAAAAFLLSAFVEFKLEALDPQVPGPNEGQLRVYNGMRCTYEFSTEVPGSHKFSIPPLEMFERKNLVMDRPMSYSYSANSNDTKCRSLKGKFELVPSKAISYFIETNGIFRFEDWPGKPKSGESGLRVLLNSKDPLFLRSSDLSYNIDPNQTDILQIAPGIATLTSADTADIASVQSDLGGVKVLLVEGSDSTGFKTRSHVIVEPNSVHILWQLPQYIVITAAEVMFSVTGLEFSFTQAPTSMKSVLQACWLLTVAVGNILVVIIAELKFFNSQAQEFILFAGLMIIDMIIFMVLAMSYTYVEHTDEEAPPCEAGSNEDIEKRAIGAGFRNPAYEPDN